MCRILQTLYDADLSLKANIHGPYKLVDGAKELVVDPADGMLHHYRVDEMETFRKHPEKFNFIEDRYLLRLVGKRLTSNVNRRLEIIRSSASSTS